MLRIYCSLAQPGGVENLPSALLWVRHIRVLFANCSQKASCWEWSAVDWVSFLHCGERRQRLGCYRPLCLAPKPFHLTLACFYLRSVFRSSRECFPALLPRS